MMSIQMNLFTKQEQTHRLREWTYGYRGEGWRGRDRLGVWGWHVHAAIFNIKCLYMEKKKEKLGTKSK